LRAGCISDTLLTVLSDRAKAPKPKSDARNNAFPHLQREIAPGPAWPPRRDHGIAEDGRDGTRPTTDPAPHFEFSRIAVFSPEEQQPHDAPWTAFSAGGKIEAQPQSPLAMGFGETPSVRAVLPPSAPLPLPLQGKLAVGSVADPLEKEADAAADRVMRSPGEGSAAGVGASAPMAGGAAAPHSVHDVLQSPGAALDAGVRAFMEPRFGHDFRQVRVHADARAAQSAQEVRARAYTVGQHVVFGAAQYTPASAAGRRLIAHELSHVVQQGRGLALQRQPVEDWNFTRSDYAGLTPAAGQRKLSMASDSSWFPAKLQENLMNTLDFVLGPTISPPATEGVNAMDFFHGHVVVKKDPATAAQTGTAKAQGDQVGADLKAKRTAALGKEVKFENVGPAPKFKISSGYPFVNDAASTAEQKVAAYKGVVEKVEPSLGKVMDDAAKIPGAAVMYHTFEFNQPSDLAAKGQKLDHNSTRRNFVTPLDTNTPAPYTTPTGAVNYEVEYTIITQFSFLVDKSGAVHVRPFDAAPGFTSLELSTITGKPYAKSPGFER
jgi:hypothetical protein